MSIDLNFAICKINIILQTTSNRMETSTKLLSNCPTPLRVDNALTNEFPTYSRNFFQQLIRDKYIRVNGAIISKSSVLVKEGDLLEVTFPPLKPLGALPLPAQETGCFTRS